MVTMEVLMSPKSAKILGIFFIAIGAFLFAIAISYLIGSARTAHWISTAAPVGGCIILVSTGTRLLIQSNAKVKP
jgi:hypothetical protein